MSEKAEERAAGGGVLENELCRLRDELKRTPEGREALGHIVDMLALVVLRDELKRTPEGLRTLRYIEDILTLMSVRKITLDLARWYVDSWTKG